MRHFTVPKTEAGFTAIELLIAIVMVGIMAAISAPSFMAMLNRAKVNNAVSSIQGALKEAQREAMRKSQQCTIKLEADGVFAKNDDDTANACLPTGDRTFEDGVELSVNGDNTINYGIRGNTNADATTDPEDQEYAITIYYTLDGEVSGNVKCLVISQPLGIVRTGNYEPTDPSQDPTTDIDSSFCTSN